jgi:hypothetical protein
MGTRIVTLSEALGPALAAWFPQCARGDNAQDERTFFRSYA